MSEARAVRLKIVVFFFEKIVASKILTFDF
jgi:hypothetical protein